MIPVRTNRSNFVYLGPGPDVGDAWVERRPAERAVMLTWQPSEAERAAIAAGALVELGIYGMEPIPPVSLNVADRPALSAEGARLRDRALAVMRADGLRAGPSNLPPGWWVVSSDVWGALNAEQALDTSGTGDVPLLYGRPLLEVPGADPSTLEYVARDADGPDRPAGPPKPPPPPRDREVG